MFSEHKKKQEEAKKNGELIFDDLESQTRSLRMSDDGKKGDQSELRRKSIHKTINLSEYMSEMETKNPKRKSIKKSEQKPSTMSLNVGKSSVEKEKEAVSSQRSNSLESPGGLQAALAGQNVGLGIFEAATMMCNIVDITTDSTTKTFKNDKTKTLKSKESKTSLGSTSGPFAQMKEAQEMKRKGKNSFEDDFDD
uniref:SMAP domain-containing protein n=1 Tax=Caenorhabditis tropicalis TaxID=1561998 RepID=A0A1I7U925_9PELO